MKVLRVIVCRNHHLSSLIKSAFKTRTIQLGSFCMGICQPFIFRAVSEQQCNFSRIIFYCLTIFDKLMLKFPVAGYYLANREDCSFNLLILNNDLIHGFLHIFHIVCKE
uniref:Uncharacterized protein n=1 Tax=Micromonas pusilla TaxID=38833 RepID=A0A7S0NKG8_MICPS